ncbi:minor capsid protein [Bacillus thuringiensis]|uniref:Minor capsid protein n=1 Tax=Bacillus thuringiensis TaxID=1428 RepID=A0A9X7GK27_BACTU|nr:minor capsid protein [Bacillus thuringiensis]PGH85771.1 minor capsid protein [Bacillus thuringiensis]
MITIRVDVNTQGLEEKLHRAAEKAQFALDEQVLKDSNFYIPKDEGELERSSIRFSRPGTGYVEWHTPYARRLYYNPQYNFSTDKNPNAQGLWFEAAKARHLMDWKQIVKKTMEENI